MTDHENSKPLVLITCPMSERKIAYHEGTPPVECFTGDEWVKSVAAQTYENATIFINLNDVGDSTETTIRELLRVHSTIPYEIWTVKTGTMTDIRNMRKYQAKSRGEPQFQHFADMRNIGISYAAVREKIDYVVSWDSDVLAKKNVVSALVDVMEGDNEIGMCSIPVNTDRRVFKHYPNGKKWGVAQYNFGVWQSYHEDNLHMSSIRPLKNFPIGAKKPYTVGYTGALCIIRASLLREPHSIRYNRHRQGEDVPFCHNIKQAGYKIVVATDHITMHMQDPRLYEQDRKKFEAGEHI